MAGYGHDFWPAFDVAAAATIRYTGGEFDGQSPTNKNWILRLSQLMPKRQMAGYGHDFWPAFDVAAAATIRYTALKFGGQSPTS